MSAAIPVVLGCGLIVARRPEFNRDPQGRGAYLAVLPSIGNVTYAGIDRMLWFDVLEDYYSGGLPGSIKTTIDHVRKTCDDFTGIEVCKDLSVAKDLLSFSNRHEVRNELITINSPTLIDLKGPFELDASTVNWIGFDVVSLGNWSLIRDGLFAKPAAFQQWQGVINEHGLLPNPDLAEAFRLDYDQAARAEVVEPLPEEVYPTEAVRIGRVNPK